MYKKVLRMWKLYKSYRLRHGGLAGLKRLGVRAYGTLETGGVDSLRYSLGLLERKLVDSSRRVDYSGLSPQPAPREILALAEVDPATARLVEDIAVHAHIYYTELTEEIRHYLVNIPLPFSFYVTTDTADKAASIETALAGMVNVRSLDVRVVPNRGRDIGPMLIELGETLSRHEVVLHIHTKRSPHNPKLRGWRRYLMQSLLGNSRVIAAILERFASDEKLGVLYPYPYHPVIPFMRIGGNAAGISSIFRRAGRGEAEIEALDMASFPAGFMFWFRGSAIEPFIRMKFGLDEFEPEAGQDDGTLAHALERVFPYFVGIEGFSHQAFVPVRMFSPAHPGAVPLRELFNFLPASPSRIYIIFAFDGGEKSKNNHQAILEKIIREGHAVLFVHQSNSAWFVEWIDSDDGLIFVETGTDALFEVLAGVYSVGVIVSSLSSGPSSDIKRLIERVEALARIYGVPIDFQKSSPEEMLEAS